MMSTQAKYSCPAERLLDVSYHWTDNNLQSPLERFLVDPQLSTAVQWVRSGIDSCGIFELKMLRNNVWFAAGPDLPRFEWTFDPNNAGPMYFLVCLTLGVVIPGALQGGLHLLKTAKHL